MCGMKTSAATSDFTPEFNAENFQRLAVLLQENLKINAALQSQVKTLTHQVEWFKRQLFGQKSEQRDFADHPYQTTIADLLKDLPAVSTPTEEAKQTVTFQRGKAKKNALEGAVEETGLRFDDSVPVEEIVLPCPELEGPDKDDYEVIDNKITHRLAQNPASFVVLKYIRPVVKKKSTQVIVSVPAPANVLEKSIADVSFLTGLLVDKFVYHLPLYRQHERLEQNGIMLARSTLTNLVKRAISLLKPIYHSQLENILLSKLLAIDETPIKAGKEKKGKLKQGYFWPIYGDCAEICFTFSGSRSMSHLKNTLGEFNGTILSDGYKAYDSYAETVNSTTHALCSAIAPALLYLLHPCSRGCICVAVSKKLNNLNRKPVQKPWR
jgi:transposase